MRRERDRPRADVHIHIRLRRLRLLAVISGFVWAACVESETPTGPPRCEPENEVWIERLLKEGFRARAEGDEKLAEGRFEQVLDLEPNHPEALRAKASPTRTPEAETAAIRAIGHLRIGRRLVPVGIAVHHDRFDFQTLAELAPLRRNRGGDSVPQHRWFESRKESGANDSMDQQGLLKRIDLIVLHDTRTATANEAFVNFEYTGTSTHFVIDADGTIHQVLDLELEANHTKQKAFDLRSVAIDLVNPVDLDGPATPERPLSDFVSLQGQEPVQQQGYTTAQQAALTRLLGELCTHLPSVLCRVPAPDPDGRVPRRALDDAASWRGIAGHLHLMRIASDPGAGFPWENFISLPPATP